MKSFLMGAVAAAAIVVSAPAFAGMGQTTGSEARGEPVNSSYRASGRDAQTGMTPGKMASQKKAYLARAQVKKKKRTHIIVPNAR